MSWALIQDGDNLLRNGWAEITSHPAALPGTDARALSDGALSIPYAVQGLGSRQDIVISVAEDIGPCLFCVLDFRSQAPAEVTIASVSVPAPQVNRGSFFRAGLAFTAPNPTISVTTTGPWSIGEIVLCPVENLVSPDENPSDSPEPHRSHIQSETWNVVENGPWRSKMAEPRRRWEMAFAPAEEERLQRVYRDAGGGLRPVVFFPRYEDGGEPVHGHLDDEFSAQQQLGGLWAEGRVLAVTESLRRLM